MNSNYTDYGRIVPGAKKFNRSQNAENFNGITKNNIWPEVEKIGDDYTDFLKQSVKNSLRQTPLNSDSETLSFFKKMMELVRDAVNEAVDPKEVITIVAFLESLPYKDQKQCIFRHLTSRQLSRSHMEWLNKRKQQRKPRSERIKPISCEMNREGVDWRGEKDITTEEFAKSFSLSGIQYGNWVTEKERKYYINTSFDSLKDLAVILNLNDDFIGLNGQLALAFGARGNGKALGHYEPIEKIINLTRLKGQGIIGHEWFHALDHYLGELYGKGDLLSKQPVFEMDKLKCFKTLFVIVTQESKEYRKSSLNLDMFEGRRKMYWSSPQEMMARAFQAYIQDKMEALSIHNDFLTTETLYQDKSGNKYNPYPQDEERLKINNAFDELFKELEAKNKQNLEIVAAN